MYSNQLELAERHVTDFLALLKELQSRGIRVDTERLDEFNVFLDAEMLRLQTKFDSDEELKDLRAFHPRVGYKRTPKDLEGLELETFIIPRDDSMFPQRVERWAKRKPFLCTYYKNVLAYAKKMGHQVKTVKDKTKDEGVRETSDNKALLWAWRKYKDDRYKDFVDFRKLQKMRTTYGDWRLEERPSGHYVVGEYTLKPETNRLSMIGNNLMTIPKRGPLAKPFRRCLVASPGCVLVEADLVSAEAVIIAWFSGDPLLMRLAQLGMHKYAMALKLGMQIDLNLPDSELKPKLDELKELDEALYNTIKVTVYGSFYLAGKRTLFQNNPEDFESEADAGKQQKAVFDAIPQIQVWQQRVVSQYYRYGEGRNWGWQGNKFINPFGYSMEFWDLEGGDGPAACAFGPQSTIGSMMKQIMLDLWPLTTGQFMNLQVHDALLSDTPKSKVEIVKREMTEVMTQPWPQLGGLRMGVDFKVGESL